MQCKWDKAFGKALLSAVTILGLSSSLCAYDGTNGPKKQHRGKHEPVQNTYAFSYPKDLNLNDPYDCFFHVEGLAFQMMETGTDFLISSKHAFPSNNMDGCIGGFSGDDENWDYSFGLRVGAAAYTNHDAWSVDLTWTWINLTNSESFRAHEGGTLIPTFALGSATPQASFGPSARGNLQCQMNVLDATLGKGYHVSRKVVFNPHFGLRFAWVDQDFSAHYAGTGIVSDPSNIFHGESDFWGVGIRLGVDTDWAVGMGFKFFANASASVLSGKFETDNEFLSPVGPNPKAYDVDGEFHMNVPNLELAVGIDWGTYLYDHRYYLDFRAGYEFQVWWDQFNVGRVYSVGAANGQGIGIDTSSRAMLTLNGFTFRIQLDI